MPGWIVRGSAGLLGGQDGVGKSLLAQQMATCAAAGVPFLGMPLERVPTIYVTCEDDMDELHRRQETINAALGITMVSLKGKLNLYSLKGVIGNELASRDENGDMVLTTRYHQIRKSAADLKANLIFVDNAAHVFAGNENDRHDVATFLGVLERLSIEIDGAVVLLAHPNKQHSQGNKQGNEYSGSTGWSAHVRNRLFLDWITGDDGAPADPDERVLRRSKSNYAAKGEEIAFRWHKWAFVRGDDMPREQQAEIALNIQASAENDRFLACLDKLTEERRAVSHSPNAGNYAPKIMARMTTGKGMRQTQFVGAMERLFSIGQIAAGQPLWMGADRKSVIGIARSTPSDALRDGAGRSSVSHCNSLRDGSAGRSENVRDGHAQVIENTCGTVRERGCPSTTYIGDAAHGAAASLVEVARSAGLAAAIADDDDFDPLSGTSMSGRVN
jgi:RecA-family ATPase